MTRKDYELIAGTMLAVKPNDAWIDKHQQWRMDCELLGRNMADTNKAFDLERFLKACGMKNA